MAPIKHISSSNALEYDVWAHWVGAFSAKSQYGQIDNSRKEVTDYNRLFVSQNQIQISVQGHTQS